MNERCEGHGSGCPKGGLRPWLMVFLALTMLPAISSAAGQRLYVSPAGDDGAAGTAERPFRTLHRAQEAARELCKEMQGDLVVEVAPGDYRLDRTLAFTEADSGRNGFRVIYRSTAGPGKARLLGSKTLAGWQPHRDGIWKADLPPKTLFHTLYENGKRVHKARFPDLEPDPLLPTALDRYLVTVDGSPKQDDRAGRPASKEPGWLTYPPEDAPPVMTVTKMRLHIFPGGKCDWVREAHRVLSIDPQTRRITFASTPYHGVGVGARFFLEDELGFLNAPGEFFVDDAGHTLYYRPVGEGNPDRLGISYPVLNRLVQFQGASRDQCVERVVLDGLALEETDNAPPQPRVVDGLGGALVWMSNAAQIEIRNCRLRNGGRAGVVIIGHATGNLVTGCLIEHMGVSGVGLSNRALGPDGKSPTLDRCENNRVHNTRITHVGELHTYAECVSVFNAGNNEVSHCELDNSVRYAITLRGNTGVQYGPPVTTQYPPTKGNRFHHIRVTRCGQDGGDMGALHGAGLNNPGGGSVNTFEQITVADTRTTPSVRDIGPDGIFLDWPKMAMDQVFRNVQIVRSQGLQLRSHGVDNGESAQTSNVSWKPGFKPELMDYARIGLADEFPAEYGGRPAVSTPPPAPRNLRATAPAHHTVALTWDPPADRFAGTPYYTVYRDGEPVALVAEPRFTDARLHERTAYRYQVAAQDGDFCHPGPKTEAAAVSTPPDRVPPVVKRAWRMPDGKRVRVLFSKPMAREALSRPAGFRFAPKVDVANATVIAPDCVELQVEGVAADQKLVLTLAGLTDDTASRNPLAGGASVAVATGVRGASYPMRLTPDGRLLDCLGGAGDARLCGGAVVQEGAGPFGGPALVLDGKAAYAEASAEFNLGAGDFTIALWMFRDGSGPTALSKGNGFGDPSQWSFGWPGQGPAALRVNNVFHNSGPVPSGVWAHVAFVRRGNQGFSYVNGEPSGGPHDLSGMAPLVNDQPLRIGRRSHEPNPAYFTGKIAGVELLDYALEPEAVRALARGEDR